MPEHGSERASWVGGTVIALMVAGSLRLLIGNALGDSGTAPQSIRGDKPPPSWGAVTPTPPFTFTTSRWGASACSCRRRGEFWGASRSRSSCVIQNRARCCCCEAAGKSESSHSTACRWRSSVSCAMQAQAWRPARNPRTPPFRPGRRAAVLRGLLGGGAGWWRSVGELGERFLHGSGSRWDDHLRDAPDGGQR